MLDVFNNSGAALTGVTLGTNFHKDASWGLPATGKRRICQVDDESSGVVLIGACSGDE